MQSKSIEIDFDLDTALNAVVSIQTRVPDEALTAGVLGTERAGHGVFIDNENLILTIGYLIAEADKVWIATNAGRVVAGYVVGYDYDTGFGLVKPTSALKISGIAIGSSKHLAVGDSVIVAGHGGADQVTAAQVAAKQEFAGYWEYVLDEAVFTVPAHPNWGGAALIDTRGRLCGIGSLLIQDPRAEDESQSANMFVPVELLVPVLDDMCRFGAPGGPARPWLGFLVQDVGDELVVSGIYANCPADDAGLEPGDVILEVDGASVTELAQLFRRIWSLGSAGVGVPLTIRRDSQTMSIVAKSVDRNLCMRSGPIH